MVGRSVPALLEDLRLMSEDMHGLVQAVRSAVQAVVPQVNEEVKYGGILFSTSGVQFGGVFAYGQPVSVEFSHGAAIGDPCRHLEGMGKGRRHIKLRALGDIEGKHLRTYFKLALAAAM